MIRLFECLSANASSGHESGWGQSPSGSRRALITKRLSDEVFRHWPWPPSRPPPCRESPRYGAEAGQDRRWWQPPFHPSPKTAAAALEITETLTSHVHAIPSRMPRLISRIKRRHNAHFLAAALLCRARPRASARVHTSRATCVAPDDSVLPSVEGWRAAKNPHHPSGARCRRTARSWASAALRRGRPPLIGALA
jgi:hypothetical protein